MKGFGRYGGIAGGAGIIALVIHHLTAAKAVHVGKEILKDQVKDKVKERLTKKKDNKEDSKGESLNE